jgi:hypothetical protein
VTSVQVLAAIQAHALLHRDQRGRDETGRIVATIEHDYATVQKLMNAIVAEGSGVAVNMAMTETIEAVRKATVGMDDDEGATAKDIAKLLKLDKASAWRRLSAVRDEGYVINLEQRRGMPGRYKVTGQKVEPIVILPATTDLLSLRASRSKIDEQCNRDEIAEPDQAATGCKPHLQPDATEQRAAPDWSHGCNRLQTGLATDNPLNGNGKSLPVARLQRFSSRDGEREDMSNGGNGTGPWQGEDWPLVCEHCGQPDLVGDTIQGCWVEGLHHFLHHHCQADWLARDEEEQR